MLYIDGCICINMLQHTHWFIWSHNFLTIYFSPKRLNTFHNFWLVFFCSTRSHFSHIRIYISVVKHTFEQPLWKFAQSRVWLLFIRHHFHSTNRACQKQTFKHFYCTRVENVWLNFIILLTHTWMRSMATASKIECVSNCYCGCKPK